MGYRYVPSGHSKFFDVESMSIQRRNCPLCDMICPFDVQHNAITGSNKNIDFVLYISGDNPGPVIEQIVTQVDSVKENR